MASDCPMLSSAAPGCTVAGGGSSPPAAGFPSSAPTDLARLKERLAALSAVPAASAIVPLGVAPLDRALPGGGLGLSGLHRLAGESAEWEAGALAGFALALLCRVQAARGGTAGDAGARPCFWVGGALPYAPGLPWLGLDPARLLTLRTPGETERLWSLEEIARSGQALAAVGFVRRLDRIAGRRLQLAAERGGTALLVIETQPSADAVPALTRWSVAAAPSLRPTLPCWRVALLQARGGRPAEALVEWDHATAAFALAAELRDGTARCGAA